VRDDGFAANSKPTYPPLERCTLVDDVPFLPNTALVFVNALGGAHGARIPVDAPTNLERYSYQCYVGMPPERLSAVLATLPDDQRARWAEKYF
jgi:hypothetical protein